MTKSEEPKAPNAVLQMILTMADTTWRMFAPILGLLIVGILLDKALGIFPWLTLLGFALGVALAALLVWNQLKKDVS